MQDIHSEIIGTDGKQYDGEQAIISLTSWKARITTVGLTLFSLISNCPGFHIVLVLSTDEFPNKMLEMPDDIILLAKSKKIEILWVKTNFKSFKKVCFTIHKYQTVPIISADDDCIYVCNYAQELYNVHLKNTHMPINYRKSKIPFCTCGPATLYPPSLFSYILSEFEQYTTSSYQDDGFFTNIFQKADIQPLAVSTKFPCYFHDESKPLTGSAKVAEWVRDQRFN